MSKFQDFLNKMKDENKLGKWGVITFLIAVAIVLGFVLGTCQKAEAASVELQWVLPSQNCDLTPLTDYDATVIRWGHTQGGPYPNNQIVSDPTSTTTVINVGDQEDTTIFFVAVGVDDKGNYSDGPGGCGTSGEIAVPFGPVLPGHPTILTGTILP